MIIPPNILKKILHKIEEDIRSNARLKLCENPETNIWSYYGTVKLTPIVLDNYLMLILTIPLIDQSLHMNLYKVHNLPMLHPTLNVHAQYELEGSYLATMMDGMFISLPTALDVKLCLITNGHLCMFNQALYPVALLISVGICVIAIGILFIWYKRKTSLTSSTAGNLIKLVPSLNEKIPTLNSLLSILSELTSSQNNDDVITPVAVSQLSQT